MAIANKKNDIRSLNGPEKAAAFLLALGEEHATKIMAALAPEEVNEVSGAMATLGPVSSSVVETLFVDFASRISSTGSLVGGIETTERLLKKVMNKSRVDKIIEDIRGPVGRTVWDKLGNVNEDVFSSYLKHENPQTVAVILSKIKPEHSSKVLMTLPIGFSVEVISRMIRTDPVQKEILDDIEQTLRIEFMNNLARTSKKDPHEEIAEIFNYFDRTLESKFMDALEEKNPDAAEKVKALMFTFEDLGKIDNTGLQTLIRVVDKTKFTLALKGASDTVKALFFANMSERAGKLLRDELESLGKVRLKDVEEAQVSIVNLAKDLAARGDIAIQDKKNGDEAMIE